MQEHAEPKRVDVLRRPGMPLGHDLCDVAVFGFVVGFVQREYAILSHKRHVAVAPAATTNVFSTLGALIAVPRHIVPAAWNRVNTPDVLMTPR